MSTDAKNAPPSPAGRLEWEPITPTIRRRMQTCYDHAMKLMAKGEKYDFDYAHDMLLQCVKNDPGNLVYVEPFLENLQKKHKNKKSGGSSGRALKKAIKENDWAEVLRQGPELLKGNPWDASTLRPMADACAAYGFHEVELRYLKNALDAHPRDVEVNKHCAQSLARVGQFDQAMAVWRRIGELKKGDPEVDKMISQLTLDKTRILSGLGEDDKATGRVVHEGLSSKPAAVVRAAPSVGSSESEAPKRREVKLSPRQKLETAIADDPDVIDNYFKLAQVYMDEGRAPEAVLVLRKALAVSGGDFKVQEKLEAAEVEQMRLQIAVAEKRAAHEGTEEAAELVKQLRDQLHRRELEIYVRRSERHPDDLQIKLELGVRLKRVGNFDEAEKTLMEVRQSPQLKAAATLELGECLQQQQKYSNALQFYERAVELTEHGDEALRKLALYRAGVLAGGLKQYDSAEKWLKTLLKLDAGYRDAKARLDKLAKLRHKG